MSLLKRAENSEHQSIISLAGSIAFVYVHGSVLLLPACMAVLLLLPACMVVYCFCLRAWQCIAFADIHFSALFCVRFWPFAQHMNETVFLGYFLLQPVYDFTCIRVEFWNSHFLMTELDCPKVTVCGFTGRSNPVTYQLEVWEISPESGSGEKRKGVGDCQVIKWSASVDQKPELRSCVKVQVAVLGSASLLVLMVSVDGKQHWSGCPGLPVPVSPYDLCARKATLKWLSWATRP